MSLPGEDFKASMQAIQRRQGNIDSLKAIVNIQTQFATTNTERMSSNSHRTNKRLLYLVKLN